MINGNFICFYSYNNSDSVMSLLINNNNFTVIFYI